MSAVTEQLRRVEGWLRENGYDHAANDVAAGVAEIGRLNGQTIGGEKAVDTAALRALAARDFGEFGDAMFDAAKEIDRLRADLAARDAVIAKAPHGEDCEMTNIPDDRTRTCTCWKADLA
jgi:hypothetical protein